MAADPAQAQALQALLRHIQLQQQLQTLAALPLLIASSAGCPNFGALAERGDPPSRLRCYARPGTVIRDRRPDDSAE